jgi:hypothetical protein
MEMPFMTHIRKHLAATETNLEIMTIALDGIQSVLQDSNLDHSRYSLIYRQLLQEQESIGWTNFLKGRLTTKIGTSKKGDYTIPRPM